MIESLDPIKRVKFYLLLFAWSAIYKKWHCIGQINPRLHQRHRAADKDKHTYVWYIWYIIYHMYMYWYLFLQYRCIISNTTCISGQYLTETSTFLYQLFGCPCQVLSSRSRFEFWKFSKEYLVQLRLTSIHTWKAQAPYHLTFCRQHCCNVACQILKRYTFYT